MSASERAPAALDRPKFLKRALPSAPPDLVPARMVNEVIYCERLAYLEWAQGEFADNVFTVDGRIVHRRADEGGRALPDPADDDADEPPPFTARAVMLSSPTLGLIAKIDVVEGEAGEVIPIEYKRGSAPAVPGGAYLPERAQVCAHVLLLREHGYACPRGEIYYAAERRRVPIVIDDWLIDQTKGALARVRELGASGEIPPPLEDSPKCKGCSLASICLPDEVALLRALEGGPIETTEPAQLAFEFAPRDLEGPVTADPWGLGGEISPDADSAPALRRLVPPRDAGVPLYVQAQGSRLAVEGDRLRVDLGEGRAPVHARLAQTSHVAIFGNVQITTQAMGALLDRDIPVVFFSGSGWYRGRTIGHGSRNVELRIAQHRAAANTELALDLARTFVAGKIRNARTLLRRNHEAPDPVVLGELEILAKKAERCEALASLLGIEGTAARAYFACFTGMLKGVAADVFELDGRNRRPPRDPVNALLSLAYSLLTKDCALAVTAVGLDPLLGFVHQPRFGRPALALDLMEEMRPLVADSVVVTALNTQVIGEDDFVRARTGVALTPAGRRRFIEAYERRMDQLVAHPIFGYRISYRRLLEVQARLLSRVLLGEIPSYPAFRTR
jgi:CRISPR-associated protein Cas1